MNVDVEDLIVGGFLFDSVYARAVMPYYDGVYMVSQPHRILIKGIIAYYKRYNTQPTKEALAVLLNNSKLNESLYDSTKQLLSTITDNNVQNTKWLIDTTEEYFKDRAIDIALTKSITIFEDKSNTDRSIIRKYLEEGLAVSFASDLGLEYEDHGSKFDYYTNQESRIPFIWNIWNDITNGGITKKTISGVMGQTNSGKTIVLTNLAAHFYLSGYKVLYVSLEMSKEKIAQRIDACLGHMRMNDIPKMGYEDYVDQLSNSIDELRVALNHDTVGKLIINEFPTSSLTPTKLRNYLDELKLKKGFEPDILVLDYINLMIPERGGSNAGSYTNIKTLAEDNRRLAIEYNYACFTATQINRGGTGEADVDLSSISESMALAHTLDFLMAIFGPEQLGIPNVMKFKQLKSRFGDKDYKNQFVMGLNKDMMQIYEIDQSSMPSMQHSNEAEFTPSYRK